LMRSGGHPTEDEARIALAESITDLETEIGSSVALRVRNRAKKRVQVSVAVDKGLVEAIELLKRQLPVDAPTEARIREIAVDHLFHEGDFGTETGFVIAGFGTNDIFPRLRSFEFQYSALGLHRTRRGTEIAISDDLDAQIEPFAQRDVMATFVEGMHPMYRETVLPALVGNYFDEIRKLLLAETPPKTDDADAVDALRDGLLERLAKQLQETAYAYFILPHVQVVSTMPKEELAVLAEAFINLTALKRKASQDQETVGGPTDVAVISKGDGFIWVKRKHYFDPKLNPGFSAGYLEV